MPSMERGSGQRAGDTPASRGERGAGARAPGHHALHALLVGIVLGTGCSALTGLDAFEVTSTAGPGSGGDPGTGAASGTGGAGQGGAGGSGAGSVGECTPGEVMDCAYSGPPGTLGVGACKAPLRTCVGDGSDGSDGSNGTWSACEGAEVLPAPEEDGSSPLVDDDCGGTMLVDDALLVRYLVNEAASGQTPGALEDAAPDPLPLAISYASTAEFVESNPGRRGLRWLTEKSTALAWASLNTPDNKIRGSLDDAQQLTLEAVVDIANTEEFNRILSIGRLVGSEGVDALALVFDDVGRIQLRMNDIFVGKDPQVLKDIGRVVLHVVLDTTLPVGANRRRFYRNGTLSTSGNGNPLGGIPAQNARVSVATSTYLALGNRFQGMHSPAGTIHYAAIYTRVLTAGEIKSNALVLLANDDAP
ncbi:hypothetical protein [Chondromyces apiculatus]|uniref:hypothetical protein n=1 Tax=Chondromyces apiculatus TaxID=51 RepID=UPI0012DDBEE4|nr:hypothetical protein [Chondromyces apiculatus]